MQQFRETLQRRHARSGIQLCPYGESASLLVWWLVVASLHHVERDEESVVPYNVPPPPPILGLTPIPNLQEQVCPALSAAPHDRRLSIVLVSPQLVLVT